jgi:ribosomal-protein-alanine N-acetyltransferase
MRLGLEIGRLTSSDHAWLLALFDSQRACHLHLDWRPLAAWLASPELSCWVVRTHGRVAAALGAVQKRGGVAWLRFGLRTGQVPPGALDELWEALRADLVGRGVALVGILALDEWIEMHAPGWGFRQTNAVVTYRRYGTALLPAWQRSPEQVQRPPEGLLIRPADQTDLEPVARVDEAAFEPLWQQDLAMLSATSLLAETFTVAELDGEIVGYQLSTRSGDIGHLARLAVEPRWQRHGLGRALVADMLNFFHRTGATGVTVNTQRDNLASQRLYERMGFRPTGSRVPVWTMRF